MENTERKVEIDLITNGFTKVENIERWFINFQGRTYYSFKDGGKWWVLINKNGSDIKLNQIGFDSFTEISDLLNALSLNKIFPTHNQIENLEAEKKELLERIEIYKECFELYIDPRVWDEATEFLSTAKSGLAKELSRKEK